MRPPMFTGLIEAVGTITALERTAGRLTLVVESSLKADSLGDSITIDGCCLTVTRMDGARLSFDAAEETLRRTSLGEFVVGQRVQMERAMRADGRFGGHIVQGHVDGVAQVKSKRADGDSTWIDFDVPAELTKYMVDKGAITLDGMSLTLTQVGAAGCSVMLVPYTVEHTQLGHKTVGDKVNVEVDVLAKYVEKLSKR